MLAGFFCLVGMSLWCNIDGYVTVPAIYRQADEALRRYGCRNDANPYIHALLNVLVYDKRAQAFVAPTVVESSLAEISRSNKTDGKILHELIYDHFNDEELSDELKEEIIQSLDTFFDASSPDERDTRTDEQLRVHR
jgi:predicted DNA-binding protein (UPF0278 family)